ncbi:hypothetical protein HDU85_001884 [Gaertneriomyces sp. JEL0708]|nr:hypothetical protein HDU85_001884 [Gaertneriomyces sp. JEL0708]
MDSGGVRRSARRATDAKHNPPDLTSPDQATPRKRKRTNDRLRKDAEAPAESSASFSLADTAGASGPSALPARPENVEHSLESPGDNPLPATPSSTTLETFMGNLSASLPQPASPSLDSSLSQSPQFITPPAISFVNPVTNAPNDSSSTLVKLLQPLTEPPLVPHIRARRAPTTYRRRKPQVNYPTAKPPYLLDRPPPASAYRVPGFPAFLQQVTPRNQVIAGEAHRNPVSARFVDRRWWTGGSTGSGEGDLAADAAVEEQLNNMAGDSTGSPPQEHVNWQAAAVAAAHVAELNQELTYSNPSQSLMYSAAAGRQDPQGPAPKEGDLLGMLLMAASGTDR